MPAPELFAATHNAKMVWVFLNVCDTYFKLTGISNENSKAMFAKTRLSHTAHTWYDSQGYNKTMEIFATMNSHILDYFIPSDYVRRTRRALVACKMGKKIEHRLYI